MSSYMLTDRLWKSLADLAEIFYDFQKISYKKEGEEVWVDLEEVRSAIQVRDPSALEKALKGVPK